MVVWLATEDVATWALPKLAMNLFAFPFILFKELCVFARDEISIFFSLYDVIVEITALS